jgi:hypothetical protein
MIDLRNAESKLDDVRRSSVAVFDARSHQNAINAAKTAHQRSQTAYEVAHQQLNAAWQRLNTLGTEADRAEADAAQAAINDAQNHVASAKINLDESGNLVEQAYENLQSARNVFNTHEREQRNQSIKNAEMLVIQAENAVADATRNHENAVAILDRAASNADIRWQDEITEAEGRIADILLTLDENAWQTTQNLRQAASNIIDADQALERAETSLQLTQKAIKSQSDDARHALETALRIIDLDIERTLIDLRADQASLAVMSHADATPISVNRQGIVAAVEKRVGEFVSQGEKMATVGVDNKRFSVSFSASISEAGFIEMGSKAVIYHGGSIIGIDAFVSEITMAGDTLNVKLISETDQFYGGEWVSIRFQETRLHDMLVPNEAIVMGAMGQYYVWTVQSRPGTLGTEYISVRRNVRIIDSDDFNTAITNMMSTNIPVITSHNRELNVNGRVNRYF